MHRMVTNERILHTILGSNMILVSDARAQLVYRIETSDEISVATVKLQQLAK
jgi:hypothetical protein